MTKNAHTYKKYIAATYLLYRAIFFVFIIFSFLLTNRLDVFGEHLTTKEVLVSKILYLYVYTIFLPGPAIDRVF